ncbi:MAG: superoxide dismutase [Chitinophagaceae bacterium]|nr:MAG: superoxide dismutase [Chitinophagaceae bacterium]
MAPLTPRREFLTSSVKAGLGLYIGSTFLSSCASSRGIANVPAQYTTGFNQQPLPYAYNALEEAIDAKTMELHYSKHAASYATNLNDAAKAEGVDASKPLEDVLRNVSKYSTKLRNNGGGHYNHELFWKCMTPKASSGPTGNLATAINSSFGSFETFKTQFSDAGKNRFGSGWAWMLLDNDKRLRIASTPNQDNPLMDVADAKGFPLLGLDVWEHAYYLRYQNKRPDYIANWWKVVNWDYVAQRYQSMI